MNRSSGVAGMDFREMAYRVAPLARRHQRRKSFNTGKRRDFLLKLAKDPEQLAAMLVAGMSRREIACLGEGRCPPGYSVHHKLPLHGGGGNDPGNLVLIRDDSHQRIHAVIDPQISGIRDGESRTVTIPWPRGAFYTSPEAMRRLEQGSPGAGRQTVMGRQHVRD